MSFASAKGSNGERELLATLIKAGQKNARRVGYQQQTQGCKPPDVECDEFYAENKSRAGIPATIWEYVDQCLINRSPQDPRPILIRMKRTGRMYPPLILMLESEWVTRERRLKGIS